MNKLTSKWFIIDVLGFCDSKYQGLLDVQGQIVETNFLNTTYIDIPLKKEPLSKIKIGDRLKVLYFVKESDIVSGTSEILFTDSGAKYEKLTNNSWDLLFEEYVEI